LNRAERFSLSGEDPSWTYGIFVGGSRVSTLSVVQ
jgi:hypothetical protein